MAVLIAAMGTAGTVTDPANAAEAPRVTLKRGTVTITGTGIRDVMSISLDAGGLSVDFGFDGTVDAQFARSRYQRVQVSAADGDDGVSMSGTGQVPVTISGGPGNDRLSVVGVIGQTGADDAATTVSGDDGNDTVLAATPGSVTVQGGTGDDIVNGGGAGVGLERILLGDGNDLFRSSLNTFVGARSDIVDGGAGQDTMEVEGTFATESVGLSASAGHLVIDRDLRDRIDADNVEYVSYLGFGGLDASGSGDAIAVNDLSGTDVVNFTPNFSADRGSTAPNGSSDTLTVRATTGADEIVVSGSGARITVSGLSPTVTPILLQPDDFLLIDTLGGDDTVDTSGLQDGLVQVLIR